MSEFDFLSGIDEVPPTPILIAPQPVLRQVTRDVRPEDMAFIREQLPGMFSAMYKAPGIGLAAPQVGHSLRFALVDVAEEDAPREPIVLINPEIVSDSEQMAVREEGCLSLPNQYAEVVRPESIRVRYRNLAGDIIEKEASDLLATCIQHEMDHLEGILFVDHLSTIKRNMIMRRLAKEQKLKRR
ncbi:peptide deformylase [Gluconobacter morbifer]|uniref:Peptide deformylase n=1 Tax=Gluconobacter morbifer G707 TaxID=1088869 RepID=G6XGD1_9PROT|nr:peptide deformylase [Gluconobacter morbifer]EHH69239.1 N-formylmethionylaminoacyl-tRNA deformylase [Gluconobacter morbifer G707]